MARLHLALAATTLLLAVGCAANPAGDVRGSGEASANIQAAAAQERAKAKQSARKGAPSRSDRKVGDFFVYQFSGSFSQQPLTLTEQVVAEEDGLFVVDFTLDDGKKKTALRVRVSTDAAAEVKRVSKLGPKGEKKAKLADYEAMMARTELVPDSNDEVVGSSRTTCLVGTSEHDCQVTTYKVTLNDEQALFSVSQAEGIPRDVGGEIVGEDGTVLYSARLVEHGNEKPDTSVAKR
jgi:hypothetical protein